MQLLGRPHQQSNTCIGAMNKRYLIGGNAIAHPSSTALVQVPWVLSNSQRGRGMRDHLLASGSLLVSSQAWQGANRGFTYRNLTGDGRACKKPWQTSSCAQAHASHTMLQRQRLRRLPRHAGAQGLSNTDSTSNKAGPASALCAGSRTSTCWAQRSCNGCSVHISNQGAAHATHVLKVWTIMATAGPVHSGIARSAAATAAIPRLPVQTDVARSRHRGPGCRLI